MSSHEELFTLLKVITDPKAVEATLKKLNDSQRAFEDERRNAAKDREEATKQRKESQLALEKAEKAEASAAASKLAAQSIKDKADLANAEAATRLERIKLDESESQRVKRELDGLRLQLEEREKNLVAKQQKVDQLEKDLLARVEKLKAIAA